jgi:hypothetical protein
LILKVDGAGVCGTKLFDSLGGASRARYIKGLFIIAIFGKTAKTGLGKPFEG